jgi:hypothetical protein
MSRANAPNGEITVQRYVIFDGLNSITQSGSSEQRNQPDRVPTPPQPETEANTQNNNLTLSEVNDNDLVTIVVKEDVEPVFIDGQQVYPRMSRNVTLVGNFVDAGNGLKKFVPDPERSQAVVVMEGLPDSEWTTDELRENFFADGPTMFNSSVGISYAMNTGIPVDSNLSDFFEITNSGPGAIGRQSPDLQPFDAASTTVEQVLVSKAVAETPSAEVNPRETIIFEGANLQSVLEESDDFDQADVALANALVSDLSKVKFTKSPK